jgi:hypothetical protein
MAISPFQRLVSNTGDVFLGSSRDQAAINAANNTGDHPDAVARRINPPTWPSVQKFDNDTTAQPFSPFGSVPNPEYIWDQPTSDGQTAAFAIASQPFTVPAGSPFSFSVFLSAFADNAMEAKIELFEQIGGTFVKAAPQPSGLGELLLIAGEPNNPAVGLTINGPPFSFEDIRIYSTRFDAPSPTGLTPRIFKIVVSFEVTNYLIQPQFASNPSNLNNPAGLKFFVDIYAQDVRYLYVANSNSAENSVEIYDISTPTAPGRVNQFNAGNLNRPISLAITGTTLYVGNQNDDTVEIYDISTPTAPVRVTQFNGGNLDDPIGLAITGTTLYVANQNDDTVEIYDISTPTAPVRVTQFNAGNLDLPSGLAITGTILYVTNQGDETVEIYDISIPTAPVRINQFNGGNLNGPVGMAITGTILYVANSDNSTVEIYDISNPAAPVRINQFNNGNLDGPTGLAITGTTLYVANTDSNTVEVYDISTPTAPVRVGEFNAGNLNDPFGLAIFTLLG